MPIFQRILIATLVGLIPAAYAAPDSRVLTALEHHESTIIETADALWRYAELGYQETRSSALLRQQLAAADFTVEEGVAGIPTAFRASFGRGEPVIAILGEFDALPGVSQAATPALRPIADKANGHACGHNLFGAGSLGAALAVRDWLADSGHSGTIRFYGTPAEEGGSGKVYMVRAGLFSDVDAVLHWHPAARNSANPESSLANKSAKFRFRGETAHAARAPERGRSALDAVEAMNFMVNLLREHVPQETRIHYVITNGGVAPNVVPAAAESFYYVRHPNAAALDEVWRRVIQTAEAAALGTGTDLEYEIIHGNHSVLPNTALSRLMHDNLTAIGGVTYSADERRFAQQLATTLPSDSYQPGSEQVIQPFKESHTMGSTDVGDVSWNVPTAGLRTATFVPGTGLHTWQAVAAGGMSIGHKGAVLAAKTLAATAVNLIQQPDILRAAQLEFEQRRGKEFIYQPLLGDRSPPLDYRK